ncbi:PEP-CTERM sorting domain-containing protein [Microseira wollei]
MAIVLGNSTSGQWQYVNDAVGDAYGGNHYEFYGMGLMEDATHVYFAINTHDMGLNAGQDTVSNGRTQYNIGYGDLLINTRGTNLATANGNLFGVHFGANSGGVTQVQFVGLYGNVTARSVGGQHVSSQATIDGYLRNMPANTATSANFFGSLSRETGPTYFDPTGFNVIQSGRFLSGIEMLTLNQLQGVGYNSSRFQGGQTVAFRIARSSFGPEQSVPEPTTILGLAAIGLALAIGKLRKQNVDE